MRAAPAGRDRSDSDVAKAIVWVPVVWGVKAMVWLVVASRPGRCLKLGPPLAALGWIRDADCPRA
jgi:hypothetical protein